MPTIKTPCGNMLGWLLERERYHSLLLKAAPMMLKGGLVIPNEVDLRDLIVMENQGRLGSCTGFGSTRAGEQDHFYATGGEFVQLSQMYCYLTNQLIDGITKDEGATMDAVAAASKKHGYCLETTMPYTGKYTRQIPQPALTEGRRHCISQHSILRNYDELFAALAGCIGGVTIGTMWTASQDEGKPVLESISGQNYGGHCYAITGYTKRKKGKRNYLIVTNSHGPDWGDGGHAEWSPSVFDQLFADRFTVCLLLSGMPVYEQRDYPVLASRRIVTKFRKPATLPVAM